MEFLYSVLHVNTTSEYEKLLTGEIGDGYDKIIVEAEAHGNVLGQPKYFWSRSMNMIFRGKNGEVVMSPKKQSVSGTYNSGTGLLYGLPLVFKDYTVDYHGDAATDESDVYSIALWTHANRIVINDASDLSHQLYLKIDALKNLNQLKHLQLNLHRNTYKFVEVKTFLETLKSLETLTFGKTRRPGMELNEAELKEFAQKQAGLEKWEHKIDDNGIVFQLKLSWIQKVVNFFKKIFGWK